MNITRIRIRQRSGFKALLIVSALIQGMHSADGKADRTLQLTQDAMTSSFGRQVDILRNAPWTMSAEEALTSSRLTAHDKDLVNLGAQRSPAWLRFTVQNDADAWAGWVLNTLRSNVEVLEIYKANDDGIELLFDNADDPQRRESLKRYFNLVAPFTLAPGESATLLVRFQAAVAGWLPMRVIPTSMLVHFTFSQFSLFIATTAGTAVLIFYNLLLFVATRNNIYILYTAATSALLLACLHLQGMTTAWWFFASPEWGRVFGVSTVNLAAFLLLSFARRFLNLAGRKRLDLWYRLASAALLFHLFALPLLNVLESNVVDVLVTSGWGAAVISFCSLPLQAFFANPGWRLDETLLGIAWSILAAQFATLTLSTTALIPGSHMDWYLLGPACITEAALVAVSIAIKVRRLQLDKDRAEMRSKIALQEMNERAQLVLAASHDARSLLSGAVSLNSRVADAGALAEARRDAEKVQQLLRSLQQTMTLMVSHNRQTGSGVLPMIEAINVTEIFDTLSLTFRGRSQKAGREMTWRTNAATVACDRNMLLRVLSNLIANALAYSDGKRILIVCRSGSSHFSFQVYDQGPGVTPEQLAQLLQPERTVRLNPQSEGAGVGLRICRDLAEIHGGALEARSRQGGASMFGLRIPKADLTSLCRRVHFVRDAEIWRGFAALMNNAELVDDHRGDTDIIYIFSERIQVPASESINIVACYDRSNENRDRLAQTADIILCFPITLPALAYAISLAVVNRNSQVKL